MPHLSRVHRRRRQWVNVKEEEGSGRSAQRRHNTRRGHASCEQRSEYCDWGHSVTLQQRQYLCNFRTLSLTDGNPQKIQCWHLLKYNISIGRYFGRQYQSIFWRLDKPNKPFKLQAAPCLLTERLFSFSRKRVKITYSYRSYRSFVQILSSIHLASIPWSIPGGGCVIPGLSNHWWTFQFPHFLL